MDIKISLLRSRVPPRERVEVVLLVLFAGSTWILLIRKFSSRPRRRVRLLSSVNLFIIRGRNKGRGGTSVIIIQIFSFARARRINIYNAFPSTNPLPRGAYREKSSRFEQTFPFFLAFIPKVIFLKKLYRGLKIFLYHFFFKYYSVR